MPVQFDDSAEPGGTTPSDARAPTLDGPEVLDLTVPPSGTLEVHPLDEARGVRVNRAAADMLGVEHRVVHRQDRFANPPPLEEPASPEEKLLRAIFGEGAAPSYPFLDADGVAERGAVIPRETRVLYDAATRRDVWFTAEESGEVVDVARTREGLPDGVVERIEVTVRSEGPLCAGDRLLEDDRDLGVVEAVVDDGASEPRLYLGRAERGAITGPSAHVTRTLPTARQSMRARAIGPYNLVTQAPSSGENVTPDELRALAERGCLALFSDFAGYKGDQVQARTRVYESLVKGGAVPDPWSEAHPTSDHDDDDDASGPR